MIKEGQKLPSFKLKNQKDEEVKFPTKEDTVIYFYPKADTPGCTKEAIAFNSQKKIIAVSYTHLTLPTILLV